MKVKFGLAMVAAGAAAVATQVKAADAIKIGVLTDLSGLYAAPTGPGSVFAARQAVADFTASHKGLKIEVVAGDHQNKPDIGAGIANRWYRRREGRCRSSMCRPPRSPSWSTTSSRTRTRSSLLPAPAASDLTGARCSPNTVHWTYDTWALANGTGKAIAKTGGDSWFFLTADYAFGHALERDTAAVVEANKGKVVGRSATRSRPTTSPPSCCRPRPRRPRSSPSPMPAATPSTRSSRRRNSASSGAGRSSPACWSISATSMRSA